MSEKISCPHCNHDFELSDALSSEMRKELENEFAAQRKKTETELKKREAALFAKEESVAKSAKDADKIVAKQLQKEREALKSALETELKEAQSVETKAMQSELLQAKVKIKESREHELTLRKEQSKLEAQKEDLKLEIARKEVELRVKLEEEIGKRLTEEQELKLADKNNLINTLKKQISDLKVRSEQGSQQAQGETLELAFEAQLSAQFPFDTIAPVPKGIAGSDVIQTVTDSRGVAAGTIIWEFKRTKHWGKDWLPKLRDDQRAAKADLAVLVSSELPKEVSSFGLVDNVWVCSISCALALATALRQTLISTTQARRAGEGQQGKMEVLYAYLAGPEFKQRLEGIAETFHSLREDLEREKRAMQSIWNKREKQLERAALSASGLHGDIHGIIGAGLEEIEYFSLESIASTEDKKEGNS